MKRNDAKKYSNEKKIGNKKNFSDEKKPSDTKFSEGKQSRDRKKNCNCKQGNAAIISDYVKDVNNTKNFPACAMSNKENINDMIASKKTSNRKVLQYVIIPTLGDGNCGFGGISKGLVRNRIGAQQ